MKRTHTDLPQASPLKGEPTSVETLETDLVKTVEKQAIIRKLKRRQRRELAVLRDEGKDSAELKRAIAENNKELRKLILWRKELGAQLRKSRR